MFLKNNSRHVFVTVVAVFVVVAVDFRYVVATHYETFHKCNDNNNKCC